MSDISAALLSFTRALPATLLAALLAVGTLSGCASGPVSTNFGHELTGSSWIVENIAQREILANSDLNVLFPASNRLAGTTGCNRFFAEVTIDATAFVVGNMGSTRMACASELMEQENRFISALQNTSHYQLDGDSLSLFDGSGEIQLKLLHPAAAGTAASSP